MPRNIAKVCSGTGFLGKSVPLVAIAVYVGIGTFAGPSVGAGGQLRLNFIAW